MEISESSKVNNGQAGIELSGVGATSDTFSISTISSVDWGISTCYLLE